MVVVFLYTCEHVYEGKSLCESRGSDVVTLEEDDDGD